MNQPARPPTTPPAPRSVALLTGCVMSAMFGDTHRATMRVLMRDGWGVEVPERQGCCGALHLHAGYKDRARRFARGSHQHRRSAVA